LILAFLVLSCLGSTRVAAGLAEPYCRAVWQWGVTPAIAAVEWHEWEPGSSPSGADFDFQTRTIRVDPDWPWAYYGPDSLTVTMLHEIGHSFFGPGHKQGYSIMQSGWQEPYPHEPTAEDLDDLRRTIK